jgi:hypothetical protein
VYFQRFEEVGDLLFPANVKPSPSTAFPQHWMGPADRWCPRTCHQP